MHITVGGAVMLAVLIVVWVFAASISNDAGCQAAETASYMSGPAKVLTRLALLCWLV